MSVGSLQRANTGPAPTVWAPRGLPGGTGMSGAEAVPLVWVGGREGAWNQRGHISSRHSPGFYSPGSKPAVKPVKPEALGYLGGAGRGALSVMPERGKCWDAGTELRVPGRGWGPLLDFLKSSLCPGDALKEPTIRGRCSACPPPPWGRFSLCHCCWSRE